MPVAFDDRVRWGVVIPPHESVVGPNERCIEIPLAREAMQLDQPGYVLDAGCSLNGYLTPEMEPYVTHLTQNIASEKTFCHSRRPLSYVSGDLRSLDLFSDRVFSRTVCVSTLEHVGFNNETYFGPKEHHPDSVHAAIVELCRVTGRRLFVSVPYAKTPTHCDEWRFFTQDEIEDLAWVCEEWGFDVVVRYYAKTEGGWYGGATAPVLADRAGFPDSVNAIACLRAERA